MSSAVAPHRLALTRPTPGAPVDAAIAAAVLVGSLAQLSHGGFAGAQTGPGELDWTSATLAACSTVPLLVWRRAPGGVFVVTAAVTVLLAGLGYPLALPLGSAVALFLFAASRDERQPWTFRSSVTVLSLFVAYVAATALGDARFPASELLHGGLAWALAWFAGERARLRHEHVAELAERALRSERDAERDRLLAVAEERARIARDLHDSAGHAINVIALRAGTARLRREPERSQAALEAIEEIARKTVDEIDQIVGTLRGLSPADAGEAAPRGLASLGTLIARQSAAGLEISVTTEGEPRRLEGAVDQAAYRILQEALTNAARHGAGAARVELAFGDRVLELAVTNAVSRDQPGPRSNGGHGLVGMRERATLLGGSLDVERVSGSFCVRASLPYKPPAE